VRRKTAKKAGQWIAGWEPSGMFSAPARGEKGMDSMDKPEITLSSEPELHAKLAWGYAC
jgi:hypothetical protein